MTPLDSTHFETSPATKYPVTQGIEDIPLELEDGTPEWKPPVYKSVQAILDNALDTYQFPEGFEKFASERGGEVLDAFSETLDEILIKMKLMDIISQCERGEITIITELAKAIWSQMENLDPTKKIVFLDALNSEYPESDGKRLRFCLFGNNLVISDGHFTQHNCYVYSGEGPLQMITDREIIVFPEEASYAEGQLLAEELRNSEINKEAAIKILEALNQTVFWEYFCIGFNQLNIGISITRKDGLLFLDDGKNYITYDTEKDLLFWTSKSNIQSEADLVFFPINSQDINLQFIKNVDNILAKKGVSVSRPKEKNQ